MGKSDELDARIADLENQLAPLKEERRRLRHSKALKAQWSDPVIRERRTKALRGRITHLTPEMREHLSTVRSKNAKAQWTPEQRARQAEVMKEQRRTDPRVGNARGAEPKAKAAPNYYRDIDDDDDLSDIVGRRSIAADD